MLGWDFEVGTSNCTARIAGNHPRASPGAPLSNTVSKQSGVYPRLARTDRVASRLWGALAVPIIFVTGIAPKPIPASSPRDARSGLAVEATATAVRITRQSTPEADCRIGTRLTKLLHFTGSSPTISDEFWIKFVTNILLYITLLVLKLVSVVGLWYWFADDTRECEWGTNRD